jgi:hypothetical protein
MLAAPMSLRILASSIALLAGLFPLLGTGTQAIAQEEPSGFELRLLSHPPWHAAGDRLQISLEVFNGTSEPLEGFSIQLAAFDRVATRSALRQSFEGPPPDISAVRSVFPRDFFDETVAPGETVTVTIDDPISRSLLSLAQATEGGVFPVTVSLLDGTFTRLDDFTTHLVYFPTPPESPLNLSLVVPLADVPARGTDGRFHVSPHGTIALEEAVSERGWLTVILNALERWTDAPRNTLRLTLAPAPRLLEELAALGSGYETSSATEPQSVPREAEGPRAARTALNRLAALVEDDEVQLVLAPYAFADLATLTARMSPDTAVEHVLRQLVEGATVVEEELGVAPDRSWLYTPGGRVDDRTLSVLHRLESAEHMFLDPASVPQPGDPDTSGCPAAFASYTCPLRIDSVEGETMALKADDGLQERAELLMEPAGERLDLQRFFADTAMVWAELPGTPGRIAHVALPPLWHPDPDMSRALFQGLALAPWLETVTAEEGLQTGLDLIERQEGGLEDITTAVVPTLAPPPDEPSTAYFEAIERAERVVESFRSVKPPGTLIERLRRNILVAESMLWWVSDGLTNLGLGYADGARTEAETELSKIAIESPGQVTLTSRRGSVQVLVLNGTDYPVDLNIRLSSAKLTFAEDVLTRTFEPATTPVAVELTAQSSGIFPLEVRLETPSGVEIQPGGSKAISVRSTEFNEIAVTLTLGALAFLIFFYAGRAIRSRRSGRSDAAGASSP